MRRKCVGDGRVRDGCRWEERVEVKKFCKVRITVTISVLNGSGRPSLAPGRPRPDPEGQVKYGSGQRGPAVGQAGGRERWRFFRPPLTWADLGPALDPEIRKRVVNLQKITLKSFISWGRVKFCVEL